MEGSEIGVRQSVLMEKLHWIIFTLLLIPVAYILVSKAGNITWNPQNLYWSEFSNIYNSSLFFSKIIYGEQLPLPLLDPARMFLDGLILIPPNRSLFLYRIWTSFLSVFIPLVLAYTLARRLARRNRQWIPAITLLSFLFFQQGPIYYHVLIAPFLILWFTDSDQFWKRILVLIAASIWAGFCRVNWIPFPGILMAVLYILETPVNSKNLSRYLVTPAFFAVFGSLIGVLSYISYAWLTGNPLIHIDPNYNFPLYWRRLFPNPAYSLGVFPGTLLVSFPLLLVIFTWYWKNRRNFHWLRFIVLLGVFFIFGLGGLIVSIRIGGTFNLHNMDGFLVFLAVIGGYSFFNLIQGEKPTQSLRQITPRFHFIILLFILLVPSIYILNFTRVRFRPMSDPIDFALIQGTIDAKKDDRPVLFLDFRHWITFGQLDIDLFLPYEKVIVMENVMANNKAYIQEFTRRIENQEFSVIVSPGEFYPRYFTQLENIMAPEENGWAENISIPIVDHYEWVLRDMYYIYVPQVSGQQAGEE
jgi:hypothetical protein